MTSIGPIAANPGPLAPTVPATEPKPTRPVPAKDNSPTADRVDLHGGTAASTGTDDPQLAAAAKAAPQALLDAGSNALGAQSVPDDLLALLD